MKLPYTLIEALGKFFVGCLRSWNARLLEGEDLRDIKLEFWRMRGYGVVRGLRNKL